MFKSIMNFLFGSSSPSDEPMEVEVPEAAPVEKKLPSASKLNAMKKEDIEALGFEFGIDLDRRKTKKNMIEDLTSHVSS